MKINYHQILKKNMINVLKDVLQEIEKNNLKEGHHLYITFKTENKKVILPKWLKKKHPKEMTIVLQYQFSDLYVDDEIFEVTLSFNNKPEKLVIPLNAISIFADPSVNFALQFQPLGDMEDDFDPTPPEDGGPGEDSSSKKKKDKKGEGDSTGEVVSLDKFRKK